MESGRIAAAARAGVALMLAVVMVGLIAPSVRAQSADWPISAAGLGPIRLGLPVDAVRTSLPAGYTMSEEVPLAPDTDGFVISFDGTVHALIPVADSGLVERVIVLSSDYRTAEGIGPESLVGDAEDIYGDATLSWSPADQGRERVAFVNGPAGLSFRTSESVGPQAGVYGNGTETVLYLPSSRLSSIWVVGSPEAEQAPAPAESAEEPTDPEPVEPADEPADPEPAESADEPADLEPAESAEPADPEPAESADEPAEPADDAGAADPEPADPADASMPEALAETGVETPMLVAVGLSLLFLGAGVARDARRFGPWS